jgi:hypothetical protein
MNASTKLFAMVRKSKALPFKPLLSLSSTTWTTVQNYSKSNVTNIIYVYSIYMFTNTRGNVCKCNININQYNLPVYMSTKAERLLHRLHKQSTKVRNFHLTNITYRYICPQRQNDYSTDSTNSPLSPQKSVISTFKTEFPHLRRNCGLLWSSPPTS